jgi:lysophospholipase L1-like esterase
MAEKRISELDESLVLVTHDYMALDGDSGTKKINVKNIYDGVYDRVSITSTSNYYIAPSGAITGPTQSDKYKYTNVIAVTKNQRIKFHASGYAINIAMISTCDANGQNIVPKVRSQEGEGDDHWPMLDYEYTVEDDGYVIFSYYEKDEDHVPTLYIKNPSIIDDHSDSIAKLDAYAMNNNIAHIFKKVVCVGDSYTQGYMGYDGHQLETKEEYSWVSHMEKKTGNVWFNCGEGGDNAHTWLTSNYGLAKAQNAGKAQAYIVGLGINDSSSSERHLDLGTSADIGTETISYYGCMSKIIVELATINSDAIIFVNTCPFYTDFDRVTNYNAAVREIVEHYKNTYNVHCLDLAGKYKDVFFDPKFTKNIYLGHPTAKGHAQIANMMETVLSDYMNNNTDAFNNIPWIDYTSN